MNGEFIEQIDDSEAFRLLSPGMRTWVARQGWNGFRPIQASSISALLGQKEPNNLLVSAPTSGGKTESAFMPLLSIVENYRAEHRDASADFVNIIYVAPLKALINDQYRRMSEMASNIGIPVYLWHGDAPAGQKKHLMKEHSGILMITPESLESFLVNRGQWCGKWMTPLAIVVDEFHAFLGEGRGKQLLSLMSRIDFINETHGLKPAIRIGLSATLSRLDLVAELLSLGGACSIIQDKGTNDKAELSIRTFPLPEKIEGSQARAPKADYRAIGEEIIKKSGNHKTLTFAKSRLDVENAAATINDICAEKGLKTQAFPHHGSLSRETREELEHRLVSTEKPTIAVATVTLELGIDIGDIYEVFQIGAPNSVASLRQRMGRSGRRNGLRKMECLATTDLSSPDMEEDLVTLIAEIMLMEKGWFEPPTVKQKDASVLVSEILSVISQYGTAYPEELFSLLCEKGAFRNIDSNLFLSIIDDMDMANYLEYTPDGQLVLGTDGEREVEDWHFYATFQSEEAYTVRAGKKTIGEITPPTTSLSQLAQGGNFMLGGRYWQVIPPVDMKSKILNVKQVKSKSSYLIPTSRGGGDVCGAIKRKRISLLSGKESESVPEYLDELGRECLAEAREYAREHKLNGLGLSIYDAGEKGHETESEIAQRCMSGYSDDAIVKAEPPIDTPAYDALDKMLQAAGMAPGGLINIPLYRLHDLVETCISASEEIKENLIMLIDDAMVLDLKNREKYTTLLSDETLRAAYAEEIFDVDGALMWCEAFLRFWDTGR